MAFPYTQSSGSSLTASSRILQTWTRRLSNNVMEYHEMYITRKSVCKRTLDSFNDGWVQHFKRIEGHSLDSSLSLAKGPLRGQKHIRHFTVTTMVSEVNSTSIKAVPHLVQKPMSVLHDFLSTTQPNPNQKYWRLQRHLQNSLKYNDAKSWDIYAMISSLSPIPSKRSMVPPFLPVATLTPKIFYELIAFLKSELDQFPHNIPIPDTQRDSILSRLQLIQSDVTRLGIKLQHPALEMQISILFRLNETKRAEQVFSQLLERIGVRRDFYYDMMLHYLKRSRYENGYLKKKSEERVESLFRDMETHGIRGDVWCWNILLTSKINSEAMDEAERLFERMKSHGYLSETFVCFQDTGSLPSAIERPSFISDITHKCIPQPPASPLSPILPGASTYNIMVSGHARVGDCTAAKGWISRMIREGGFRPNIRTVNAILYVMIKELSTRVDTLDEIPANGLEREDEIWRFWKEMSKMGIEPNEMTLCILIGFYAGRKDFTYCRELIGGNILGETAKLTAGSMNMLLDAILRDGQEASLRMFKDVGLLPDARTYAIMMNAAVEREEMDIALAYLNEMQANGIPRDVRNYNILLKGCLKESGATSVTSIFDMMNQDGIGPDDVTYNTLITGLLSDGEISMDHTELHNSGDFLRDEYKTALRIYEQMFRRGVVPKRSTFNFLLHLVGKRDLAQVLAWPDSEQSKRGKHDEYEIGHQEANLEKSHWAKELNRGYEDVSDILRTMDSLGIPLDVVTYSLLIRNSAYQDDIARAEVVFRKMVRAGVKPNVYTFANLLYAYVRSGDLKKAEKIIETMEAAPFRVIPNIVCFTELLFGWSIEGEFSHARDVYDKMIRRKLHLDIVAYTVLANMFVQDPRRRDVKSALRIFDSLREVGVRLDNIAYVVLLGAHAAAAENRIGGNGDAAFMATEVWREMIAYGIQPTAAAAMNLMNVFKWSGQMDQARAVFDWLRGLKYGDSLHGNNDSHPQYGTQVNIRHCNSLLGGFIRNGQFKEAQIFFREMQDTSNSENALSSRQQSNLPFPDSTTFDIMLKYHATLADWSSLLQIFEDYRNNTNLAPKLPLLYRTYEYVLKAYLELGRADEAKYLYQQLVSEHTNRPGPSHLLSQYAYRWKLLFSKFGIILEDSCVRKNLIFNLD